MEKSARSVISNHIAEIQGLYGPVSISEELLQKIWLRGDFFHYHLNTVEGFLLNVKFPGIWNKQEGPDFKGAVLEIDGQSMRGDVEIHFYASDWLHHQHDKNNNYNNVVLHVVLFEPSDEDLPLRNFQGDIIPTLVLLPVLPQDIEEYALEEALLAKSDRYYDDILNILRTKPASEQRRILFDKSIVRWERKLELIEKRLQKSSWQETCHQLCLEVLGYRRNRAAMYDLAIRFPLVEMCKGKRRAEFYYNLDKRRWKLTGLRPNNHPLVRIRQYLKLIDRLPQWPDLLESRFDHWILPHRVDDSTSRFRKKCDLKSMRLNFQQQVLADCLSSTRLDTLICDAILPMLAVHNIQPLFYYWFHWYSGDLPHTLCDFLKKTEITDGKKWPACNGYNQGILQLYIENGLLKSAA